MELDSIRFLLKLDNLNAQRSKLATSFKEFKTTQRDRICLELASYGLIEFSSDVDTLTITPAGTELLKLDLSAQPLSPQEIKLITVVAKKPNCKPSSISFSLHGQKISAAERNQIVDKMIDQGFLNATYVPKKKGAEVWLTPKGREGLQQLAKFLTDWSSSSSNSVPTVDQVFQTITAFRNQTEIPNYLPLYALREHYPNLEREQLDQMLYSLAQAGQIELIALSENHRYNLQQIQAGIPQPTGGPLFFIEIVDT